MSERITWTNSTRKLRDLIPWAINPALIGKDEARRLEESLDQFGQVQAIAISPTNEIYDGHQRQTVWGASKKFGMDYEVDVRISSRPLTEDERKKLVIYLRKGAVGQFDFDILANNWEFDELVAWGFDEKELLGAGFEQDEPEGEDPGAQVDKAEELRQKWGVEPGQLWKLGEHRLICGDCTDRAVVEKVMGGEKAGAVVTDPPYGIGKNYEGEDLSGDDFAEFHNKWMELACGIARDDTTVFYIFSGSKTLFEFADVIRLHLEKPRLLIWYRPDGHGAGGSDYFYNYDPLFYGSISEKIGHFEFADYARDVWIANKAKPDAGGFEHSTVKAMEVIEQPIRASSSVDDIIADFFLGSGTTLIACERLERKCRAVEISPAYCAVAIQRWVDMTGGVPELIEPVIQD